MQYTIQVRKIYNQRKSKVIISQHNVLLRCAAFQPSHFIFMQSNPVLLPLYSCGVCWRLVLKTLTKIVNSSKKVNNTKLSQMKPQKKERHDWWKKKLLWLLLKICILRLESCRSLFWYHFLFIKISTRYTTKHTAASESERW